MANIQIYTKDTCAYCRRAKALLDSRGVKYTEFEVSSDAALQHEMMERSGRRTVPQVFIDDRHVGGSDDLAVADNSGLLDELLNLNSD